MRFGFLGLRMCQECFMSSLRIFSHCPTILPSKEKTVNYNLKAASTRTKTNDTIFACPVECIIFFTFVCIKPVYLSSTSAVRLVNVLEQYIQQFVLTLFLFGHYQYLSCLQDNKIKIDCRRYIVGNVTRHNFHDPETHKYIVFYINNISTLRLKGEVPYVPTHIVDKRTKWNF